MTTVHAVGYVTGDPEVKEHNFLIKSINMPIFALEGNVIFTILDTKKTCSGGKLYFYYTEQ